MIAGTSWNECVSIEASRIQGSAGHLDTVSGTGSQETIPELSRMAETRQRDYSKGSTTERPSLQGVRDPIALIARQTAPQDSVSHMSSLRVGVRRTCPTIRLNPCSNGLFVVLPMKLSDVESLPSRTEHCQILFRSEATRYVLRHSCTF
jgi:hypothetical protein